MSVGSASGTAFPDTGAGPATVRKAGDFVLTQELAQTPCSVQAPAWREASEEVTEERVLAALIDARRVAGVQILSNANMLTPQTQSQRP
jgi:hypothetical protein